MKKQHVLIVLMLLMITLAAASASALQITSATIGDDNQDRVKNVSVQVTVTNDGNTTLNDISLNKNVDSKYNIRFSSPTITTLQGNGGSTTVTVTGDIPLDFSAIDTDDNSNDYMEAVALKIGTITASATGATPATADLKMQAVNQLELKKATLECGDTSKRIKDGTDFEDLKPDTSCSILVEVENKFDDKDSDDDKTGDIDFDEADVEILVDDSDFDVDESDSVDPDPDDTDEVTLDFDIDEDVSDGSYDLIIRVIGQDDNGAWHGEQWKADLRIDRLKHDLQIKNAAMNPTKMDCKGGQVKVDAKIINLGKRDEDDVVVELTIPDLDLTTKKSGIELDEDDYTRLSFVLTVPEDVDEGVYLVNLNTYFDGIAPSNTKVFNLAVEACEVEEPEPTTTTTTTTVTTTPTEPADTTPAATAPSARVRTTSEKSGFWDSSSYLWILGVLIAAIVIIIIVLIVVLVKKPR